jgi:RimJ/RimL family protein N-acetyltransferase
VANRSGFAREAVLRSYMRRPEEREDMVSYSLLAPGV